MRFDRIMWGSTGTVLLLAGCGGGGSTINTAPPTSQSSPGGIWEGIESVSQLKVEGIVDESGNFQFVRSDGVQYVGKATVSGTSLTANMEGIVPLGFAFDSDGSRHGTGTVNGTVTARSSIQSNTTFKTDNGTTDSGTLNLTFSASYNRASALSTIAGNFLDTTPKSNMVLNINSNGVMFSQDSDTGCVLNGTVSIINTSYNAYSVQFNYASCIGDLSALNGVQFSGFATLDNTASPEQLLVAATGASGNQKYSQVIRLVRN